MEQIGINSNVLAGGKLFHIQTAGNMVEKMIKSEVYDGGRVIMMHKKKLDDPFHQYLNREQFQEFISSFHHEIAWEIELLFYIRDKIKTVKHAVSNNKMGLVFLRKGMIDEAIGEFAEAIEKDNEMIEAYNNLGTAYMQKSAWKEAIDILKRGCELAPQFPDLRNNLGLAYTKMRTYLEALDAFQSALKINPNYTEVYINMAMTHIESVMYAPENKNLPPPSIRKRRALENIQKIVSFPGYADDRALQSKFDKAIKELNTDDLAKSLRSLYEAREMMHNPKMDETIHGFYLKFLFGGAGKDDKVLNEYRSQMERGLDENPNYADLHNSLGLVYLIQCRNLFLKAVGQFKKAHDINPTYKNAYRNYKLVQNDGREFLNLLRAILK
ncbi:tetratricopeptide repeat protein [bacterium]|nr:tetratricopeptide repeat protein [bacterium]